LIVVCCAHRPTISLSSRSFFVVVARYCCCYASLLCQLLLLLLLRVAVVVFVVLAQSVPVVETVLVDCCKDPDLFKVCRYAFSFFAFFLGPS